MFNKDPTMAMKKNLAISLCMPLASCCPNVQYLSEKYLIKVATKKEIVLYIKDSSAERGANQNKSWNVLMSKTSANPPAKENLAICLINVYFLLINSATHSPKTARTGKAIKNSQLYMPAYFSRRSKAIHATAKPQTAAKIISFLFIELNKFIIIEVLCKACPLIICMKYKL